MKKSNFLILTLLFVVYGCNNNGLNFISIDENTFLSKLDDAPEALVDRANLPDWLNAKIDKIEETPLTITYKAEIFEGIWDKKVVYFIRDSYQSCIYCEIYYENGNQVKLSDSGTNSDLDKFRSTSDQWKLIYERGDVVLQ